MRRVACVWLAVIGLVLFATAARADDLADAIAAHEKGDIDTAIALYTKVIDTGAERIEAFYGRGACYASLNAYEEALKDLDHAVAIRPTEPQTRLLRGTVFAYLMRLDDAIDDFTEVIAAHPDTMPAYGMRGRVRFIAGDYAAAARDLARVVAKLPGATYEILWLHLARVRAGTDDTEELAANAAKADLAPWPGPLLRYMIGAIDRGALDAAAASTDPYDSTIRQCDLNFHLGQLAMAAGRENDGRRMLTQAFAGCPRQDMEVRAAEAALGFQRR